MRISLTLSNYIGRQFLISFFGMFIAFLMLILLFDTIELIRRSGGIPTMTFSLIIEMALLKLPFMGQKAFPFAILFGGMATFWRLTRSHELEVTRAAGVSAWQFLIPVLFLAFVLGLLKIGLFNPLASTTLSRYERLESYHLDRNKDAFSLSKTGLWLRQANDTGQSVVHAGRIFQEKSLVELSHLVVFVFDKNYAFKERIDADKAYLEDGFWRMEKVWLYSPDAKPRFEQEFWLETNLTLGKIQDSFAPPETMSFWDLPGFISTMEKSGFSALRHRLHWHSLLAAPLLACAMILIAATFTLRHVRRGGAAYVIAGGVFVGFLLYFFSDVIFALGLSDKIPVSLAAWTPSGVSTLLGMAMLFHLEDG